MSCAACRVPEPCPQQDIKGRYEQTKVFRPETSGMGQEGKKKKNVMKQMPNESYRVGALDEQHL